MKYYITKAGEDGEMVEMKMEKPEYEDITSVLAVERNANRKKEWQAHIASLPRVKHRLPNKVGDIVEEGKDFEWDFDYTKGTGTPSIAVPKERVSRDDWVNARTDDTYKGPTIVIIHK